MKKFFSIFFAILMMTFVFVGCGKPAGGDGDDNSPESATKYEITVSAGEGGSIQASALEVEEGGSVTITVSPDYGYLVKSFRINGMEGESSLVNDQYTCDSVTADMSFSVTFETGVCHVATANAPTIDGDIDDVWNSVPKLYVLNGNGDFWETEVGYVQLMWNEAGMYFLGVVTDSTIVKSNSEAFGDRVNFWIGEEYLGFATNYYVAESQAYGLCLNPDGTVFHYNGYYNLTTVCTSAGKTTSNGYIVEAFVPVQSKEAFATGDTIGLDISIDYCKTVGTRDAYLNWYGIGAYWSSPCDLKKVKLLG